MKDVTKKPTLARQQPEKVVKMGDVTASIFVRQSHTGFRYYDYELGRSWKSLSSAKELSGTSFFNSHEKDLVAAIREASAWIAQNTTSQAPT